MRARPVLVAVGVLGLVLAVLVARVLVGAATEFEAAQAKQRAGELMPAITHYRHALAWYVPLSPYDARSIAQLRAIADRSRARNEPGPAVAAERALHAGLSSARSFYQPHAQELAASDARLRAIVNTPSAPPPPDPNAFFSLLAALAWFGFVLASFGLIMRPVSSEGRLLGSPWRLLGAMALGFAVFSVSLALA